MSQGVAVEASILARLLGVRLLKLDAQIVVLPVEPVASPDVVPATVISMSGSVEDAERERIVRIGRCRYPDGSPRAITCCRTGWTRKLR